MDSEVETTFQVGDNKTVEITLDEVKLILSLIDVVSKRGGFTPRDFTAVGKIFDKFSKFTS